MRIALLNGGSEATELEMLAGLLRERGLDAEVLPGASGASRVAIRAADALLARRGFAVPLARIPLRVARLCAGRYDVVHTFAPADAMAANLWRAAGGGTVVFTSTETLTRSNLADRRLRLSLWRSATQGRTVVRACSPEVAATLDRWLAVHAPVLELADARGHEQLYRDLLRSQR